MGAKPGQPGGWLRRLPLCCGCGFDSRRSLSVITRKNTISAAPRKWSKENIMKKVRNIAAFALLFAWTLLGLALIPEQKNMSLPGAVIFVVIFIAGYLAGCRLIAEHLMNGGGDGEKV